MDADPAQLGAVVEHPAHLVKIKEAAILHHGEAFYIFAKQHDLLLDNQDGNAMLLVQFTKNLKKLAAADRVQLAGRLIQNDDFRLEGQNRGHGDLLLLPAAQGGDAAILEVGDANLLHRRLHTVGNLRLRDAEIFQPEEELILHHGGDHLGVDILKNAADHPGELLRPHLHRVHAGHPNLAVKIAAVVMWHNAADAVGQGGFSGAGVADNPDEIPLLHRHVDMLEGGFAAVCILKCQILDLDDRHGRHPFKICSVKAAWHRSLKASFTPGSF